METAPTVLEIKYSAKFHVSISLLLSMALAMMGIIKKKNLSKILRLDVPKFKTFSPSCLTTASKMI